MTHLNRSALAHVKPGTGSPNTQLGPAGVTAAGVASGAKPAGKVKVSVKGSGPGAAESAEAAARLNVTAAAPAIGASISTGGMSTAGMLPGKSRHTHKHCAVAVSHHC